MADPTPPAHVNQSSSVVKLSPNLHTDQSTSSEEKKTKDDDNVASFPSWIFCCDILTPVFLTDRDLIPTDWLKTFISQTYTATLLPNAPWSPHIIELRRIDPENDTGGDNGMYEGVGRWFGTAAAGYIEIYPTEQLRRELECVGMTGVLCPEHQTWYELYALQFKKDKKTNLAGVKGSHDNGEDGPDQQNDLVDSEGTEEMERSEILDEDHPRPANTARNEQKTDQANYVSLAYKAQDYHQKKDQNQKLTQSLNAVTLCGDSEDAENGSSETRAALISENNNNAKEKGKDKNAYRCATEEARKKENKRKAEQKKRKQLARKGSAMTTNGDEGYTDSPGDVDANDVPHTTVVEGEDEDDELLTSVFHRCAVM